jgi:hypothetical protein
LASANRPVVAVATTNASNMSVSLPGHASG